MKLRQLEAGQQVRCLDGTWGLVKVVRSLTVIVKVKGLDEEWDRDVIDKVR